MCFLIPALCTVGLATVSLGSARAHQVDKPASLKFSVDSKDEKGALDLNAGSAIALRPNQQQSVYFFVFNPGQDNKARVAVRLFRMADDGTEDVVATAEVEDLESKRMKLLSFKKAPVKAAPPPAGVDGKPAAPAAAGADLGKGPPFRFHFEITEFLRGKAQKPVLVPVTLRLRQPQEYVKAERLVFDRDSGKLSVALSVPKDPENPFSGPPCDVELALSEKRLPGLLPAKPKGKLRGKVLAKGDTVELTALGLQAGQGTVTVTADGYERAFAYRNVDLAAGSSTYPDDTSPFMQVIAPRYALPGPKFPVTVEVDRPPLVQGAPADTSYRLQVGLTPKEEGELKDNAIKDFPGLRGHREEHVELDPEGPGGAIRFKTTSRDWKVDLDAENLRGQFVVRSRWSYRRDEERYVPVPGELQAEAPVLFDDERPAIIAFGPAEPAPLRGKPLRLLARGKAESGIAEVTYFIGKLQDGKVPDDAVKAAGVRDEKTDTWSAVLPAAVTKDESVTVKVLFTSRAGLSQLESATIELAQPPAPGQQKASITGKVTEDGRPQPKLKVVLLDDKGMEKATTMTDEKGKFVFGGLAPGTYKVTSRQGGASQTKGEVTVKLEEGAKQEIEIKLKR